MAKDKEESPGKRVETRGRKKGYKVSPNARKPGPKPLDGDGRAVTLSCKISVHHREKLPKGKIGQTIRKALDAYFAAEDAPKGSKAVTLTQLQVWFIGMAINMQDVVLPMSEDAIGDEQFLQDYGATKEQVREALKTLSGLLK